MYCARWSDYTLGRTHIHVHALFWPATIRKVETKAIFFGNSMQLVAAAADHWMLHSSLTDDGVEVLEKQHAGTTGVGKFLPFLQVTYGIGS